MTGMFNGLVPFMAYSASVVSVLSATVVPIKNFNELVDTGYELLADPLIGFGQYLTHGVSRIPNWLPFYFSAT